MEEEERDMYVEEKRKRRKLAMEGKEFYYNYEEQSGKTSHDEIVTKSDYTDNNRQSINVVPLTRLKTDTFTPPFSIPEGMVVPETKRHAEIIERTARYLNSSTDPQLEILIKAKQAHNRDFAFLDSRHYLHEYYKHVRWIITSGLGDYASSDDEASDDDSNIDMPSDNELKQFIDRMAEFIAQNGDEFEGQIRANHSDPSKLAFMDKGATYQKYYRFKVKTLRTNKQSETENDTNRCQFR
ncbi:hypothetical protein BDF19DRAFT_249342 [Syncephalis fuscata]|nr:hypothetical protein BDF19DRAFT_249342 [Syncephalis fuscata]